MLKIFKVFKLVFIVLLSQSAFSQGQGNNPYSVLGVGEFTDETVAAQDMMGGTGVSFANTFYINHVNPAMLVKNRTIGGNKYVGLNVGFKGGYKNFSQNGSTASDFGLNLNNLSMAFPVKPWYAIGISIRPLTIAEYVGKYKRSVTNSNISIIDNYTISGGLSRVALTNSFQLAKGLYAGLEGQYNFGNIVKDSTRNLESNGAEDLLRYSSRYSFTGASLKAGLTYQYKLSKKWNLNIGATYQLGSNIKGEQLRTFSILGNNPASTTGEFYIQQPDTLLIKDLKSELPSKYRIGLSLESNYHWVIAAEYSVTNWSNIKQFEKQANTILKNSSELNFGLEWLPNSNSSKYIDQVFYRAGFKSVKTPYTIAGTEIKDNSFSLGVSFPMGFRNPSYIDMGVSVGQRGTNANGLIKENYTKISVSFSLLSSWFNKPRIE